MFSQCSAFVSISYLVPTTAPIHAFPELFLTVVIVAVELEFNAVLGA